jgi:cytochrome c
VGKIKVGGSGVWGPIPMPMQNAPDADIKTMANWLAAGAAK